MFVGADYALNRDERKTQREAMLLFALAEWPRLNVSQLAYLIGVSERTCYRYLSSMRKKKGITIKRSLSEDVRVIEQRVLEWQIIGGENES